MPEYILAGKSWGEGRIFGGREQTGRKSRHKFPPAPALLKVCDRRLPSEFFAVTSKSGNIGWGDGDGTIGPFGKLILVSVRFFKY